MSERVMLPWVGKWTAGSMSLQLSPSPLQAEPLSKRGPIQAMPRALGRASQGADPHRAGWPEALGWKSPNDPILPPLFTRSGSP